MANVQPSIFGWSLKLTGLYNHFTPTPSQRHTYTSTVCFILLLTHLPQQLPSLINTESDEVMALSILKYDTHTFTCMLSLEQYGCTSFHRWAEHSDLVVLKSWHLSDLTNNIFVGSGVWFLEIFEWSGNRSIWRKPTWPTWWSHGNLPCRRRVINQDNSVERQARYFLPICLRTGV